MTYHKHSQLEGTFDFFHEDNHVRDDQEIVYTDNGKYFDDWLADIDNAQHTLIVETFIFAADFLGERVAGHLIKAAQRGVKVRLMVDGMGALFWHAPFRVLMEQAGIKIVIFHPAPWRVWQWGYALNVSKSFLARLLQFLSKTNSRDHRKVTIIDGKIAWVGSINITKEHLPKDQGGGGWCDAAVRLYDLDFSDLEKAFIAEWDNQHYQDLFGQKISNRHIRLNNTLLRRMHLRRNLYRKLRRANRKIWITNAYFVPTGFLLYSLQLAAWTGVDVRIILPGKNNHRFMGLAGAMFYEKLIASGVKLYLYPEMIHEKSMIIDTWATIGSSNLNHRSLFRDLEVDVILSTVHGRVTLENHFLDNIEKSRLITLEELKARPWWKRMIGHVLLLGRYFL